NRCPDQRGLSVRMAWNPHAIASKGCKMISKTMTAGDIDAILAGTYLHLDNPDGGYCFNAPTVASSK
uniref:hypothetical protein n=1 Tax=Pseudomonas aeruginosa TaxID=287 RepID=UPI001C4A286C